MAEHATITIDCDLLPEFTCAYLRLAGDECAFVETNTAHAVPKLLTALARAGREPESVRWIVITHAHLDHAGGASALAKALPNATILAHPRTAKHLVDPSKLVAGALEVYGPERFATMYGSIEPIAAARVRGLDDGATFELGGATLRVHHTAGHAWHHFVVDDPAAGTVYTGDAFGLVYPRLQRAGRLALATTSPTGFDAKEARKSVEVIVGLGRPTASLTHFGQVADVDEVASHVRAWIDRSEAWVAEAARTSDDFGAMTARIAGWIRAALEVEASRVGLALTDEDRGLLSLDVELNAQGLAVVALKERGG